MKVYKKRTDRKTKAARGARVSNNSLSDLFQAYLHLHAHALFSSLGRIFATPVTSLMTISVLAIAISLTGGFYLLLVNVQQLTGNIEAGNQISVFLKQQVSDQQGRELFGRLQEQPEIAQLTFISKQQALDEFREYSGFGEALQALESNPLPVVIQLLPQDTLRSNQAMQSLLVTLQGFSEVDFVQMDMQWVKRLQSFLQLAQRGVILLSLLLGLAVLFITGNTIRLELQNRREEVLIAKLVGATHGFIRKPFIYIGFWYGFLAGLLALVIVTVITLILQRPVTNLSRLYDGEFAILFLSLTDSLLLLLISALLGIIGAMLVLNYQLRQMQPV